MVGRSYLPPEIVARLENIEKRARYALEENSFKCFWGRFVPVTAWNRWRDENEEYQKQFYAIRDEVISNLPESIGQLRRHIYTDGNWRRTKGQSMIPKLMFLKALLRVL